MNILKLLLATLIALLMQACVTASWETPQESFKLTSFFKSVDGLKTTKGGGLFSMEIDKTHTQDPMGSMLEMLQLFQALRYGMPPAPQPTPPDGS